MIHVPRSLWRCEGWEMMAERALVEELEERWDCGFAGRDWTGLRPGGQGGWPGFPDALLVREAVPAQMSPPLDSRSPKCLLWRTLQGLRLAGVHPAVAASEPVPHCAPPQGSWVRICSLNKISRWLMCTLKPLNVWLKWHCSPAIRILAKVNSSKDVTTEGKRMNSLHSFPDCTW